MKKVFVILFFFFNAIAFSQEKMSYYFDSCKELNLNRYDIKLNSKVIYFSNSKDSTYSMSLFQKKDSVYANLYNFKKKILINFSVDFKYNNVEDLKKLKKSRLYQYVTYIREKKNKKYIEDFEYEIDSINKETLVHITQHKNNKRKKIINEHYYYFSNNENIKKFYKDNMKDYLVNKYNLIYIKNQNLEKIICVIDGKKQSETEILKITKIDYTFSFTPDQVYPIFKLFNNATIINTTQ